MQLNRTKNTFRNIIWGSLNKCILIIFPFIVKTVIIKVLGVNYLGLNNLFASIIAILNLSELGFSSAIVFSLYKPLAEDDTKMVCALMKYYRRIYRVIGCVVLGVGLILLPFLPKLINGSVPEDINIYILYLIYLGNDVLGYFLFAYKSCLLTAHQRDDIISKIKIVVCTAQYILQITLLLVLKNYYLYIIVQPFITIIINIWNAHEATRLYPQYLCKGELEKTDRSEIRERVGGLMISKVASTLRNSLDNVCLSTFVGLSTVAIYGNYHYILSAIFSCMLIFSDAVRAGIGNSVETESKEKNYNDMRLIMFIYMWLTGLCSVCLLCLYQPFMYMWVGEELSFPFSTVICMVLYFYALCQKEIESLYCDTVGYWWKIKKKYIIETILNIVMNFTFVQIWGVNGVVMASVISTLCISLSMGIPYLHKFYFSDFKARPEYVAHGYYFLVIFIACIITYFICSKLPMGNMTFFVKLIICIIIPNLIFSVMYCRSSYFKKMLVLIKKQIKRMTVRK